MPLDKIKRTKRIADVQGQLSPPSIRVQKVLNGGECLSKKCYGNHDRPTKIETLRFDPNFMPGLVEYLSAYHDSSWWKISKRVDSDSHYTVEAGPATFNCAYAFIQGCKHWEWNNPAKFGALVDV